MKSALECSGSLLHPIPRQAGPVQLAVRYLSAAAGARVGGDLYEVVTTPEFVRLIVGDVEGKGLPGVASAATVLGVFREAAHDERSLAAIVARIETSLGRQLGDEQCVTAVLARISVTIPFEPGTEILFYTDGASEARNRAGEFFPLADCAAVRYPGRPATLADRLSDEITRYVGHAPDDDVALLLAYRNAA